MALRYLARRVGIPALRQASGPRVTPSAAGSGPLASRSSQAGYSSEKQKTQEMMERVRQDLLERKRRRMIQRWMYIGSFFISMGLVVYTVAAVEREMDLLIRERDIRRELRETMERDGGDEEMGESEMDADKKE